MLLCDLRDLPMVERRVVRMSHTPDAVRLRRKIEAEVDLRANPKTKAQHLHIPQHRTVETVH